MQGFKVWLTQVYYNPYQYQQSLGLRLTCISLNGYLSMRVIIDRLTKYGHFISLSDSHTRESLASIYLAQIHKLHGNPESIVSDRDVAFQSSFWKEFFHLQGTKPCMSTVHHPQSDSQTSAQELIQDRQQMVHLLREHMLQVGPFEIIDRVGLVAYKLKLPEETKVHNIFHVSLLKGRIKNKYTANPKFPDTDEYPVAVLDTRKIKVRGHLEEEILVQWSNLLAGDATWERSKVINLHFPDFTWS